MQWSMQMDTTTHRGANSGSYLNQEKNTNLGGEVDTNMKISSIGNKVAVSGKWRNGVASGKWRNGVASEKVQPCQFDSEEEENCCYKGVGC
ncbi:hypothetical protein MTR_4g071285 [Medicago truncatula]|uniref:Uncharacterized protein n=1 Tax=Medicago truncatula TaxID=3880 RepID=A0A072UX71_MEDTR|nr:hypothetical protein MTR_4g071285 [Medicago truncatula]